MSGSENDNLELKKPATVDGVEIEYHRIAAGDGDLVRKGQRYQAIAGWFRDRFDNQLDFFRSGFRLFLLIVSLLCYFFVGGVIVGSIITILGYKAGAAAFLVGGIILWGLNLLLKWLISDKYYKKAQEIWDELQNKYVPLRNKYIEEKATECGCTSINSEAEEWDLPMSDGYIKGTRDLLTYVFSSMDNYGDIIVKSFPKKPETGLFSANTWDPKEALERMDKEQTDNGYTVLDVGVEEFNNKYRVYTKNEVKARTYFSASMIVDFLESGVDDIDYRVFGNNILVEEEVAGISSWMDFNRVPIMTYFSEVNTYFKNMSDFKTRIENENRFIYK